MARLGEILLSEKLLTSKELDSALENQALHGVKLGTCLVEMGYVSDDDLARCLGKKMGKAFLSKDQLLEFGVQNLSVISPSAIKKHRIIPVGIQGRALRIATDHDVSPKKQAELEKFIGRNIDPVAVSGYAVDLFFEKIFGIQRPGRFLPKYSRVKTPEKAPIFAEKDNEEAAQVVIDGIEWKSLGDVTQNEEPVREYDDVFNATQNCGTVHLSLSGAAEQLSHAKSRDDVAKTILDYLSTSSGTAALVIIKDGIVRGWKAYSNRKKLPEFEAFSSPLETLPDLQQCVVTKKPYVGSSMTAETKLLLRKPHHAGGLSAFFPIMIQQRVIAVLLCDGSEKLNPIETSELCRKASYALEILILRSKLLSA
jgi:hypothetical protein